MNDKKPSVLFLCTGNAFRSQMGEGLMRHLAGDRIDVFSAGSAPAGFVHPLAIRVMSEAGIDISSQRSKGLDSFGPRTFDYVMTVCDHAATSCPALRGSVATHRWPMPDPSHEPAPDVALMRAREVRDALRGKIEAFLKTLDGAWAAGAGQ